MSMPAEQGRELFRSEGFSLEELVDRAGLQELVEGSARLFGLPLRVFDADGALLAHAATDLELYRALDRSPKVRAVLQELARRLKTLPLEADGLVEPCVTGARYRVAPLFYDGRELGRIVLGPFVDAASPRLSAALLDADPGLRGAELEPLFGALPHVGAEHVRHIGEHLAKTLDMILFSGHKALLTSSMHLASAHENYRQLQEKNYSLQQAFDRLKELDRLKSNFLATVSHELRTPLTSIIGYSEMLIENIAGELTAEQLDFVKTIHEKGEQLLHLIKSLLDLSKLESGTMSLRKADTAVDEVIEDVVQTLTPAARKRNVRLAAQIEAGLPMLWADKERLRQVILNLTENALKFTPAGGRILLSAQVVAMEANGVDTTGLALFPTRRTAIELRVADTGIGIPEAERERVFDAFYQVDSSSTREQGGTGLGLSIVRRLVDGHGGTVRIEDNAPSGAVFVVTIPCRRASMV